MESDVALLRWLFLFQDMLKMNIMDKFYSC
jgi:hypothetical protein